MVATLVLLDLEDKRPATHVMWFNVGSPRFEHCTASIDLGSTARITGCTVTLEATLPIFIDRDLRYLKRVRRYKIVRFKNSIVLVQYLKRSSHQSLGGGGGGHGDFPQKNLGGSPVTLPHPNPKSFCRTK